MNTEQLTIGKTYDVKSNRKGNFRIQLTEQCETWATGIILKGKAKAILSENERSKDESITLRKSLTSFQTV